MKTKKFLFIIISLCLTILFLVNLKADNNNVYFGLYYQTKIEDSDYINYLNSKNKNDSVTIDGYQFIYASTEYFGPKSWYVVEPIEWEIIGSDDTTYTLMSKKSLFKEAYNSSLSADMSWENSTLRDKLNNDFYNEAFSKKEKESIVSTKNSTYCLPYNNAYVDKTDAFYEETEEKVYILSEEELAKVKSLLPNPTGYCGSDNDSKKYWLRGKSSWASGNLQAKYVNGGGELASYYTTYSYGVRPVIRVNKNASFTVASDWEKYLSEKVDEISPKTIKYLAMSELAYCNCNSFIGKTVSESGVIESCTKNLSNDKLMLSKVDLSKKEFTKKLLSTIKNYKIKNVYSNTSTGFYAVSLESEVEHVLAFRGSGSLFGIKTFTTDWFDNAAYGLLNIVSNQMEDTLKTVTDDKIAATKGLNFVTTGHSLGGGLAVLASNYANVDGFGFDGSPTTDVSYYKIPNKMGKEFYGIDKWKSIDYIDENCPVGALDKEYKNYISLEDSNLSPERFTSHNRWAITTYDKINDSLDMSPTVKEHIFTTGEHYQKWPLFKLGNLIMGSSESEKLYVDTNNFTDNLKLAVIYGGSGKDKIYATPLNDTLIGGPDDDILVGDEGNDKYIYFKGHGTDSIIDYSGNDTLELHGFTESDKITITSDSQSQIVKYNGKDIVIINKQRGALNFTNSFVVKVFNNSNNLISELKIEDWNKWKKYKKYVIACPTKVEIYDKNDNLLLTLENETDEIINNEYGSFYVNKENGELVKHVLLDEDYKLKVVATDNGNMNFYTVENNQDNITFEAANNIEISKNEIFEVKDNNGKTELYNGKDEKVNLQVTNKILADSIKVNNKVSIELGSSYSLNAKLNPSNSNEKIYYSTMDNQIATVDNNGRIKGISVGNTKVNVYTDSGIETEVNVTIKKVASPKKTSIKKITSKKKALKVTFKKTSGVKGYQIQYSLKKNFKSSKTVTIKKSSTTSKTISKLKRKKKYYVRVRTYREVLGKKYYSSWSSTKNKKTK